MPTETQLAKALALIRRGASAEAESLLRSALEAVQPSAEALNLLAFSIQQQGRLAESVEIWAEATRLEPTRSELFSNLAGAQLALRREAEAAASARQAINLDPSRADAHANLGGALRRLGQWEEAVSHLRRASELRPDFASYRNNLGDVLQQLGRIDEAIPLLRSVVADHPANLKARSDLLMAMNYGDAVYGADLHEEARRYGAAANASIAGKPRPVLVPREPGQSLRIGLVSADLRTHSVARFLPDALTGLKTRGVQLFAYPTWAGEDQVTAQLRRLFAGWTPIDRMSDRAAAHAIAADNLDILIDLSGHTGGNRLPVFAFRPAQVTATWIGYSGTTGLETMDYIIADRYVLPPEDERFYSERPWRLPDCYLLFSPAEDGPEIAPLPAAATGRVTFGSFNNLSKIGDDTLDAWARILKGVPGSRLVLKSPTLPEDVARRLMVARLAVRGIEEARLEILGRIPQAESHLSAYSAIDIALDPFPYAGTTTTFEALWMGRPVVTLRGNRFTARVGDSVLSNLGLTDWIAPDVDAYVDLALRKAADISSLQQLSASLRDRLRASPLGDADRFADNLLNAFNGMLASRT
ncbi:tetratricopeptide repeat protein [Devosia sp. ZB163]|uniref:O-linked N-acetylglucosamine transferase, SPINDLY family protein n=1 Tax=Devosia sp. ZB163 TaxID=3025938 RepID=UPI002361C7AB|nr:glycosyltransferase family 41 protein [Devosia sp. ZB163]MDC9824849.1 tetratricopeptide repeat protein [Devosia sp. ZB163]